MSLTSALKEKESPLSVFMGAQFPETKALAEAFRAVRPPDDEALSPPVPAGTRIPWGTLNAAIDHRLRYAFTDASEPPREFTVVLAEAHRLAGPKVVAAIRKTGMDLWSMFDELVTAQRPGDRSRPFVLPEPAEAQLRRLCYAITWFEEIYRTGRLWPGTPLGDAGPELTVADLLDAVPEYAVQDLVAQVCLASDSLHDLRTACQPSDVRDGPTFFGSGDVGGADADLIVGDLLIDIKGTASPSRLGKSEFYQLLGYALLDYDDEYGIRRLGFYLSRFGRLITWPIEEYLSLLGSTRTLSGLRGACANALAVGWCYG